MDLKSLIEELNARKAVLETAIVTLREIQQSISGSAPRLSDSRRGRKSMGEEERREVSARMKRYWETRRASADFPASTN